VSVLDLARPEIRALKPYSSARMEASGGSVLLNANESPWPAVMAGGVALNRYPEPQPDALIEALAALYGVAPTQVLAGRGSDEAIDLLVRTFCRAGRYAVSAAIQGAAIVDAALLADFSLDADALLARIAANVKLVFLCSPNNPTGNLIPLATIERIAAALTERAIVVVDEAYIEFAGTLSAATLLDRHDNLAVLRTLSKAHALAAARIGVVLAHQDVVALLRRILPAYPLPAPCVEAALTALTPPALAATRVRVTGLVAARDRLASALKRVPELRDVLPSAANFIVVRCADADALYGRLLSVGIVVRNVSHYPSMAGCLRISVGSPSDHARLLAALGAREEAA